jgi:hypothetical protein
MYNLFLDDYRIPAQALYWECEGGKSCVVSRPLLSWIVVKSYKEFVEMITKNGIPRTVSFDHDLHVEHYVESNLNVEPRYGQYQEKTGYECLQWLAEYCKQKGSPLPKCYVHTFSARGRENMFALIEGFNHE